MNMLLAQQLGDAFAGVLRQWLSPDEWSEMRALNATPDYADGCCASQDFCDANMAMDTAWRDIVGDSVDADSDWQAALWNAAWTHARRKHIQIMEGDQS